MQWQADHFGEIPVIVVGVPARRSSRPFPAIAASSLYGSIYPSLQNLLLAARAAGLGAALITLPLWSTFLARRALGPSLACHAVRRVPLGWPPGRTGPPRARPVGEVVHLDRWGNRPFR